MRHPQLLVFERDGRLAQLLRALSEQRNWSLREPRQLEHCWRLLREGHPSVLVLRVGSKVETELALLERVAALLPMLPIVVVGDVENEALTDLAWDLGASCVLLPPLSRDWLPAVVAGLMDAAIGDLRQAPTPPAAKAKGDDHAE